jgi:hypothetical protein
MIQSVGTAGVDARWTTGKYTSNIAIAPAFRTEGNITPHVKIESSVAIIVKESGAGMNRSGLQASDPSFGSHIGKGAIVVVKNVAAVLGHEKIGEAVISGAFDPVPARGDWNRRRSALVVSWGY